MNSKLKTRNSKLIPTGEPPVIDHESAVLHDFDSGLGESLCRAVIANA
jgi:hypothetical protein